VHPAKNRYAGGFFPLWERQESACGVRRQVRQQGPTCLFVEGLLQSRQYENREGTEKTAREAVVTSQRILDGGKNDGPGSNEGDVLAATTAESQLGDFPFHANLQSRAMAAIGLDLVEPNTQVQPASFWTSQTRPRTGRASSSRSIDGLGVSNRGGQTSGCNEGD